MITIYNVAFESVPAVKDKGKPDFKRLGFVVSCIYFKLFLVTRVKCGPCITLDNEEAILYCIYFCYRLSHFHSIKREILFLSLTVIVCKKSPHSLKKKKNLL